MKQALLLLTLTAATLTAAAQATGYWRAASKTATSITGDITFAGERLTINFSRFPVADIRPLTPDETAALFDVDSTHPANATLYRVSIPATQRFLHKNTLCGTDETQWLATVVTGKDLQLAFFSGIQDAHLHPRRNQQLHQSLRHLLLRPLSLLSVNGSTAPAPS